MKFNMSILLLLVCKAAVITALTTSEAFSKDYIDLLQLTDNDEFQWGLRENLKFQSETTVATNNQTSFLHRLAKRQLQNSRNLFFENKNYGACDLPSGEQGQCRQMIYCRLPELQNDVWRLVSQLCIIEKSNIGICCPIGQQSTGPQILSNDNNDLPTITGRIVNYPEQRGCGITTRQFPRIVGGRPAEPDEWPWMVALLRQGLKYVWCGGVLITDRLVLTAAHCLHKQNKTDISIRLGEYDLKTSNETRSRDFRVANWVLHIDYNPFTNENDIALMRINRPTIFNSYIWTVCMPPLNENWNGKTAIIAGWGTQTFGGQRSDVLMEASIPVWSNEECQKVNIEHIPDTMMCAGYPEGGHDACQGDSGGPLLMQLPNGRWVVIGVVSWGAFCGLPNSPGMYTRVNRYLHWIVDNSDI